jgi:hypothetical protein
MLKKILIKIFRLMSSFRSAYIKYVIGDKYSSARGKNDVINHFQKDEIKDCYEFFKKYFYQASFMTTGGLREYGIKEAIALEDKDNLFLEFGVFTGNSINYFSKFLDKDRIIYGFDSFVGLRENWLSSVGLKGISFNLNKKLPKVNSNCVLINGWVQDTLDAFLIEKNVKKIGFVHMDLDTYESSKYVLEKIKPFLSKNSVIIFDNLYNKIGWKIGEFKALNQVFEENEIRYEVFAYKNEQVLVRVNISN